MIQSRHSSDKDTRKETQTMTQLTPRQTRDIKRFLDAAHKAGWFQSQHDGTKSCMFNIQGYAIQDMEAALDVSVPWLGFEYEYPEGRVGNYSWKLTKVDQLRNLKVTRHPRKAA